MKTIINYLSAYAIWLVPFFAGYWIHSIPAPKWMYWGSVLVGGVILFIIARIIEHLSEES